MLKLNEPEKLRFSTPETLDRSSAVTALLTINVSLPSPPTMVSALVKAAPMLMVSSPTPASMLSSPPDAPLMESLPAPPFKMSLAVPPVIVSAPAPPVTFKALVAAAPLRFNVSSSRPMTVAVTVPASNELASTVSAVL